MRTVPRNQQPKIDFFRLRLSKWEQNAAEIGLNPDDVASLAEKTEAARVAMAAQHQAQQAAEAATLILSTAIEAMASQGAAMLQQIRGKAVMSGEHVYPLAEISPPSKGSPIAKPGTPEKFSFVLDSRGALRLKWTCKNPRGSAGTMYNIYRQVNGQGGMTFIGQSGKKRFTDNTVPIGAATIQYQIQAIRTTATGDATTFNVNFGVIRSAETMRQAA